MATFNSFQIDFTPFSASDIVQLWQSDDTQISLVFSTEPLIVVWQSDDTLVTINFAAEPYSTSGFLMPGPEATPIYVMRAYKTTPTTGHVYWEVEEPDLTGERSGFSPTELTDIVIYHQCCTPSSKND